MSLGKSLKPGFLMKEGRKGKFLGGTIKTYGNNKGIAQQAIKGKV